MLFRSIGIGGSGPAVKWPIENWIKLIDYLNKKFLVNFIIAGGKNDETEFNLIIENPSTINQFPKIYTNLFTIENAYDFS